MKKLILIFLLLAVQKATLVNYLDTRIVVEVGSDFARFLQSCCGYVLINGKHLPPPPWVK